MFAFTSKHAWGKINPNFLFKFWAFPPATGAEFFLKWKTISKMSDYPSFVLLQDHLNCWCVLGPEREGEIDFQAYV